MRSKIDVSHHFADLGDVLLHYVTAGKGPAVVLLHGWPQTWWEWRHVIPALAEKYTVIAPDMRGLGDSSRPLGGYDKKTVANDIWLLVAERLGHSSFFLVGHDWGGPTAFALAAAHPQAVRRLVILDVVIPGGDGDFSAPSCDPGEVVIEGTVAGEQHGASLSATSYIFVNALGDE
ncbi:MAG: alpha/beta hydrolase, partial [Hyphomicrobiaceae bacterium]